MGCVGDALLVNAHRCVKDGFWQCAKCSWGVLEMCIDSVLNACGVY